MLFCVVLLLIATRYCVVNGQAQAKRQNKDICFTVYVTYGDDAIVRGSTRSVRIFASGR